MHQFGSSILGQGQSITIAGSTAPPQPNALEQHENSLSALCGHLANLHQRALNLSDRLFGSQPEPVTKNETAPSNPPAIRRLEDLMALAHSQIDALTRHIDRLERL